MRDGAYSTNMAAPFMTATRTMNLLKGVHVVSGRWLLTRSSQTPAVCRCLRLHAAPCRSLHVSPAASKTEPHSTAGTENRKAGEEEEEEAPDGPEYIPKKKAKNPMMKIGYAWMIGLPTGIIGFILAKREVDKNRLKQLKVRQRMKRSNEGDFEGSRYRPTAVDVKVD